MKDVYDFGAACDGKTDDTAAIQAALDTGEAVFFGDPQADDPVID